MAIAMDMNCDACETPLVAERYTFIKHQCGLWLADTECRCRCRRIFCIVFMVLPI